jgi:GAF domain-containing protein
MLPLPDQPAYLDNARHGMGVRGTPMHTLQRIIEQLLLITGASRAILQLDSGHGEWVIAAEAVQHSQHQIRHHEADARAYNAHTRAVLHRLPDHMLAHDLPEPLASGPAPDPPDGIRARMLVPLIRVGHLTGAITLHAVEQRPWSAEDKDAMHAAQEAILAVLTQRDACSPPERADLRSAATQAMLEHLRVALDVQRCTYRQPVQPAYAFPVTYESRADGIRSLLGDFTIVQTGQPVIVTLLAERKQVVQEDCSVASTDPVFHQLLAHYGGLRAQMVTPVMVGGQLKGVLSVHELRKARRWRPAEQALAAEAAALLGAMFEV